MMRRLAPTENINGASAEESAALAGLLSTAAEGAPNKEVAGLVGLLAQPNKPATEKAENDNVIKAQIQGLMAELHAVRSGIGTKMQRWPSWQGDEAKVKVIVYKDAALAKLEEKNKHLVTVPHTASKANSADTETCLRGT